MSNDNSKFVVFQNADASSGTKQPLLHNGELARAGGEPFSFKLWASEDKNGNTVLSGELQPSTVDAAAKARRAQNEDIEMPAGITLDMHAIVLFKNDKTIPDGADDATIAKIQKRPDYYGYSRTAEGINRHSVWEGKAKNGTLMLRGSTEAWTPKPEVSAAPARPASEPPAKVKQAAKPQR